MRTSKEGAYVPTTEEWCYDPWLRRGGAGDGGGPCPYYVYILCRRPVRRRKGHCIVQVESSLGPG